MKNKMEVAQWLKNWLEIYVKDKNRKNTYACYHYTIKMILDHNPSYWIASLEQMQELDIQQMIHNLFLAGYSKSTLENARTVMKQAYDAAIRNHLCQFNPASSIHIPVDAKEKKVPALTMEQQILVEEAAEKDVLGHLVLFLLNTGLRSRELCNLKWADYFPIRKEIYIRESKTKYGVRFVPLVPVAQQILEDQEKESEYIFTSTTGNPITATVLKKLYARIRKLTGLDFITTHVYRHTFATRLVERGVDYKALSQLLGHKDVTFTLQRYAHPDESFLRQQISLLA